MRLPGFFNPLVASRQRRDVLLALTSAYMLVQLSSLPVAISLPTLSDQFETSIDDAAWIVIIYLLMLGSLVMLAARMGDRFGHARIFFLGLVATTVGSGLIALSQELWQIVVWRALTGLGSAFVMGNANAILAANFRPGERGRAFAVPIIGARFGTLVGLAVFGLFLHFLTWRLIFVTFLPLGAVAVVSAIPLLAQPRQPRKREDSGSLDWIGSVLLVAAATVLILSGTHLHGGEESFVSPDGLTYHLPMHGLFILLLITFVLVERRVSNPVVPLVHFQAPGILDGARGQRDLPLLDAGDDDAGADPRGGGIREVAPLRDGRAAA